MRKCEGELIGFKAGDMSECPLVVASVKSGDDSLHVVRPTRKQAVLAANRLLNKLGWKLDAPWEAK